MKAITIRQPWAQLIAIGEKKFETRSWRTDYRGDIAIHAGLSKQHLQICLFEPFSLVLPRHGYHPHFENFPLGAVVAIAELADCHLIGCQGGIWRSKNQPYVPFDKYEKDFGDFGTGRWAWRLTNVRKLDEPMPAIGKQGLWNWDGELDAT